MNNDLVLGARVLGRNGIRRIPAALGRRVECLAGSLWITQKGDRRDIVLEPGQAFEFDHTEGFVGALADSRYLLLQPCVTAVA